MAENEKNFDPPAEYLTKEAFDELQKELEYLIGEKRNEISELLNESASLGDLSENAEYQDAKEQQLLNEQRIAQVEDLLSRGLVVAERKDAQIRIGVGSNVVLKKIKTREVYEYKLVGSEEADPALKKISNESPLGFSLLQKKKGDKVKVETPSGKIEYVIIKIE